MGILSWMWSLIKAKKSVTQEETEEMETEQKLAKAQTLQERLTLLHTLEEDDSHLVKDIHAEEASRVQIIQLSQQIVSQLNQLKKKEGSLSQFEENLLVFMSKLTKVEVKKIQGEEKVIGELREKVSIEKAAESIERLGEKATADEKPKLAAQAADLEKKAEGMTVQEYNDERTTKDEF